MGTGLAFSSSVYSALTVSLFLSFSIDSIEPVFASYCNPTV